jgi:sugar phosphate isomerase/epimerase
MRTQTRRGFVRDSSLALAGLVWSRSAFANRETTPPLAFSTLACPKWSLPDILTFAAAHGYVGIELRGILDELDLTKCREFSSEHLASTKQQVADDQLRIVSLGSSAALHHADGDKRRTNLDEARRFIHLAHQLDCPHVRVFPDALPKDQDRDATIDLISRGLLELADFAKGSNVDVLMETHGDVLASGDLLRIMHNSENAGVGLVWDVCNMWSVTKEPPRQVYGQLRRYIRHTHIKDVKLGNGEARYVLLGQGDAPIAETVQALVQGEYKGYYCFEWEKRWHPEIEEPEIALAHFPQAIKKFF